MGATEKLFWNIFVFKKNKDEDYNITYYLNYWRCLQNNNYFKVSMLRSHVIRLRFALSDANWFNEHSKRKF